MDFDEVIDKRRTVRRFTSEDVPFENVKRIMEAGMKAPTWDHNRNWQFVFLRTREEKERAFKYAKSVVARFDERRYEGRSLSLSQEMYVYAMRYQYTMLVECPWVVVPLFRCNRLNAEWVSKLNPFADAWCVVENMLLAATNEGLGCSLRIPLNKEHDVVKEALGVPDGWMIPCFVGIGHPDPAEDLPKQYSTEVEGHIHFGSWKGEGLQTSLDTGW